MTTGNFARLYERDTEIEKFCVGSFFPVIDRVAWLAFG